MGERAEYGKLNARLFMADDMPMLDEIHAPLGNPPCEDAPASARPAELG